MKLRFKIDQAACFRAGIDAPKSIVTIEVDPSTLTQDQRELIASRLDGIDVCELGYDSESSCGRSRLYFNGESDRPYLIVAKLPTLESLLKAISVNEIDSLTKAVAAEQVRQAVERPTTQAATSDPIPAFIEDSPGSDSFKQNKEFLPVAELAKRLSK